MTTTTTKLPSCDGRERERSSNVGSFGKTRPNIISAESTLPGWAGNFGGRREEMRSSAVDGGCVETESTVKKGKEGARLVVGTQLLSAVVVVGLIATVVPLDVAFFVTILSTSCAICLVWIFLLIQYYSQQHNHTENLQLCPSLSVDSRGDKRPKDSFVDKKYSPHTQPQPPSSLVDERIIVTNSTSTTHSPLWWKQEENENSSGEDFSQVVKTKAESQVENYYFILLWILCLSDWFFSLIVLSIDSYCHPFNDDYINLSFILDNFIWCVQIIVSYFTPILITKFYSHFHLFLKISNYQPPPLFPPNFCVFVYILFVRRLGVQLLSWSLHFPFSLLIHLTSLAGLALGKALTNYIFSVTTFFTCCPHPPQCHPSILSECLKYQQKINILTEDYSENPANLRRRSSENGNGINVAALSGIGGPKQQQPPPYSPLPPQSLLIPTINLLSEDNGEDKITSIDGLYPSPTSSSASNILVSPTTITLNFNHIDHQQDSSTSGGGVGVGVGGSVGLRRLTQENLSSSQLTDLEGQEGGDIGDGCRDQEDGSLSVISRNSCQVLEDQVQRRALNSFSLSRCHSAAHITLSPRSIEIEKMRRTSLPAALPAQRHAIHHGSAGIDTALLLEAHGLVTDMLMDQAALPAHIVAGLKALATLLTPPPLPLHYQNPSRPRPAPLTLSTDPDYTSDIDEIPYTGEKIWSMPKRNSGPCKKGGVSANLLRRMSTSTWTTTTSATGMPTLEPQPNHNARRRRSATFRTAMDGTPGSSPTQPYGLMLESAALRVQSMAASCSPSSSSAHLPNSALQASHKSRSFSTNAIYASSDRSRRYSQQELSTSQRKTLCSLSDLTHLSALAAANAVNMSSITAGSSSSVLSSPAGTPIPSPLHSPLFGSRDPSPSNLPSNLDSIYRRLSSPPKLLFHPRSSSFTVVADDGAPGKNYLENPDDDNCSTASTLGLGDGPGPPSTIYNFPDNSGSTTSSHRLSPVTFTLQEPIDDQPLSSSNDDDEAEVLNVNGCRFDLLAMASDPLLCRLNEWDYPIFDLEQTSNTQILSHVIYKVFLDVGLFETFKIPIREFINYFHALEMGYRDKPYHNRMHAADVLHGVYYLTSQPIPGFEMLMSDPETPCASDAAGHRAWFNVDESSSYGIMGANFPALELMAMYTAAAMHDYDHPGRTNAFLVTTHAPQAILYNDRSVLENHHAAAAWSLLFEKTDDCNFLKYLDKAEFKRFRYLVIEAILATDLKRHFEILAEFNAKANEEDSPGIDWNLEADRLLVMEMCIKLADINGPCKFHDIHVRWTHRIAEEFYEQGDEEEELGLPISPYMDRKHPQLAKLQESFINHLVAPLCKAVAEAGILPGFWEDEEEGEEVSSCVETDNENDSSYSDDNSESKKSKRKILCLQTKHLQDNHRYWMNVIKEENRKKEDGGVKTESVAISTEDAMETIEEENNTPHSLNRSFSFEKEDSKL